MTCSNAHDHPFIKQSWLFSAFTSLPPAAAPVAAMETISMAVLTGKNGLYEIAQLTEINLLTMMESGFGLAHRVHRPSVYK
jgi:hypothetical protein